MSRAGGVNSGKGGGGGNRGNNFNTNQQAKKQAEAAAAEEAKAEAWNTELEGLQALNPTGHYINANNIDEDKYFGASKVLGDLHRAQYDDWTERFRPKLEQLARYADSGELTHQAIGLADSTMNASFDSMERNQQMAREGLGIQQTHAQQAASSRATNLGRAAATVSARNQTRIAGQDRDMQILAGGAGVSSDLVQKG